MSGPLREAPTAAAACARSTPGRRWRDAEELLDARRPPVLGDPPAKLLSSSWSSQVTIHGDMACGGLEVLVGLVLCVSIATGLERHDVFFGVSPDPPIGAAPS